MKRPRARIVRDAAPATQSGGGDGGAWTLTIEPTRARTRDPLMGWTSSDDMRAQVRLEFATREEAVRYAERRGMEYDADPEPRARATPTARAYADNFAARRARPWTH